MDHFGLNSVTLGLVLSMIVSQGTCRKFIPADNLMDEHNILGHLVFVTVLVSGPGVLNTLVIPWMYLIFYDRLREGLRRCLRDWADESGWKMLRYIEGFLNRF